MRGMIGPEQTNLVHPAVVPVVQEIPNNHRGND